LGENGSFKQACDAPKKEQESYFHKNSLFTVVLEFYFEIWGRKSLLSLGSSGEKRFYRYGNRAREGKTHWVPQPITTCPYMWLPTQAGP
jgi:hypothetical protein